MRIERGGRFSRRARGLARVLSALRVLGAVAAVVGVVVVGATLTAVALSGGIGLVR